MKKILAIILTVVMTAALAAVAFADSINPSGHTEAGTTVTVKKVDASVLKKDGVISEGEYERADINVDEDNTFLHIAYNNGDALEEGGLKMLPFMEYYFSWSDGQINVAVRSKPPVLKQVIPVNTDGEYPGDDFCKNTAFTISSDVVQTRPKGTVSNFYFAVCKRTDTGDLQIGYYGADQRGNSDSYIPQAYTDYVVAYDGDYAVLEWSIPFSEIAEGGAAGAGDSVYLSIGAEAGSCDTKDGEDFYAVSLGDFTYLVSQKSAVNHAAFLLSEEEIPAPVNPTPITPDPDPTPAPVVNPDPEKYEIKKDEQGNDIVVDKETGEKVDVTPAKTGDPMIIMAAVAAVSAAGAFIVRKKRH
ncbi:MAG: hypothetical protein IJK58_04990 [Clostridia bacterium]|nr:hypothetical protein [Clostridia bacterium]